MLVSSTPITRGQRDQRLDHFLDLVQSVGSVGDLRADPPGRRLGPRSRARPRVEQPGSAVEARTRCTARCDAGAISSGDAIRNSLTASSTKHGPATVDDQIDTSDPRGLVGREEQRCVDDVVRVAGPAKRYLLDSCLERVVAILDEPFR